MKNYLLILSTIAVVLATSVSCNEEALDVPPATFTEENFLTTEGEFERGIIGVYQKLLYFYNFSGQNYLASMRLLPSDDLTTINANPFDIFSGINAANSVIENYYRYSYQLISRANTMFEEIEQAEEIYESDSVRRVHQGEALFLRGYTFFVLWNFFGDAAPIVTERIIELEEIDNYPSAQNNAMLDQAIADFTTAAELLPINHDRGNLGRATKGSAWGMAGKSYLFRATIGGGQTDYENALAQFDKIKGYELVVPYGNNFSPDHENNAESLFEIQFGGNSVLNNPWVAGGSDDFAVIGDLGGYWRFFERHFSIQGGASGRYIPTLPLIQEYNPQDPRYQYSLFEDSTVAKYIRDPGEIRNGVVSLNNARILRYADVLLMQAEAIVRSGGSTAQAVALINQVRARARNSADSVVTIPADYSPTDASPELVMEWIMEERRQELAFEEWHRWFDLRRWHLGNIIDLTNWDFGTASGGFVFTEDNLYFPIPASEILINPNLTQNAGY